jgi:hypothetical protein
MFMQSRKVFTKSQSSNSCTSAHSRFCTSRRSVVASEGDNRPTKNIKYHYIVAIDFDLALRFIV